MDGKSDMGEHPSVGNYFCHHDRYLCSGWRGYVRECRGGNDFAGRSHCIGGVGEPFLDRGVLFLGDDSCLAGNEIKQVMYFP